MKVNVINSGWMESGLDANFVSRLSIGVCHDAISRIRFDSAKHNCFVMIGFVSIVMCSMWAMIESRSEAWEDSGSSWKECWILLLIVCAAK